MSSAENMPEAMAVMADMMANIVAGTAGYRIQLENAGFSPSAAEQMAVEYHSRLLSAAFAEVGK